MIYQHPLAYLVGIEGLALMRAWAGEYDEEFVRARLSEVRGLLDDPELAGHPGVRVATGMTAEAYEQWAPSYDDGGNELLQLDLPLVDEVLATLPPGVGVDVGCGTGRLAERLAAHGHAVLGVDASAPMLEHAHRRVPAGRFVVGDLRELPVETGSVDVLTTGLALTHVPDLDAVLAECARVLRPGGTAIVSDVHPDLLDRGSIVKTESPTGEPRVAAFHRHTVADHVRAALAAGLVVRRLEELRATRADGDEEPSVDLASWRWWPWSLLDRVPEAAGAAWDVPAVLVLVLER